MPQADSRFDIPFLREGGIDSPVGITPADEQSGFAFSDAKRAAAMFRSISQDAAGLPKNTEAAVAPDLETVVDRSNLLPACFLDIGAHRSAAICLVKTSGVNYRNENTQWCGTGFMVSDNILLTNHHVLNSPEVAANAKCIFNFQVDETGQPQATKMFRVSPNKLFLTSPVTELDFTFVFVEGDPGKEFGRVPLDRSSFKIVENEFANIIQHPEGGLKTVVVQENTIRWQDTVVTHYTADTQPGSSGSCVFNNQWEPVALHHASKHADQSATGYSVLNEGIKMAAIAAYLEKLSDTGNADAKELLKLFKGVDPAMGFFGALGRTNPDVKPGVEAVVDSYRGESADIDVGFWNVEWLANATPAKIEQIADVIAQMNLDIWAFEETSPKGTEALVNTLWNKYRLQFNFALSEPRGTQITGVIWNAKTVSGTRHPWPDEIEKWLAVRSQDFDSLRFEAVEGKVFDRYPALFHFSARNRDAEQDPFDFFLVPLHLKAMAEGSKRRRMAATILAAAVRAMKERYGSPEEDWVFGGDFNAELATGDFDAMLSGGMVALSAADEEGGAFSYLKKPKSMIDHIFLSAHLAETYGADDYFIVAADKKVDHYVQNISDHRPVLVRLSLKDKAAQGEAGPAAGASENVPDSLRDMLRLPVTQAPAPATPEAVPGFERDRAIDLYIPLLNACYALAFGASKPDLPAAVEVIAEIRSDSLESFEALDELTPTVRVALMNDFRALEIPKDSAQQLECVQPDAFGYVVREKSSGAILVCVRGTLTPAEWVMDFTAIPSPFSKAPEFGAVHLGFDQMWCRIRNSVTKVLNGLPADARITLVGHSLGAAMVTLGAVDLYRNFGRKKLLDVCTFGGPRVGKPRFQEKFDAAVKQCFRVVNQGDIVPSVPLPLTGWTHVGVEIDVRGGVLLAHLLPAYLAGLKALQEIAAVPKAVAAATR